MLNVTNRNLVTGTGKHLNFLMKRINKNLLLTFTLLFFIIPLKADEGMWIPLLLEKYNIEDCRHRDVNFRPKIFIALTGIVFQMLLLFLDAGVPVR